MCETSSHTSPIAVSQPSTYSCCPISPMSVNTSSFGRYLSMDSSSIDLVQAAPVVVRAQHLNYYVTIALVFLGVWVKNVPFYKASILKWYFDAETLIRDSYLKFHDQVYQIKATEGLQVLIPTNFINELRALPEDVLSAREALSEALMSKYTKFCPERHQDILPTLIRTKLTQNLARLIPQLKEEVEFMTATEFPECKDWTPVKFQPFALRCVARTSGRAFVGPSICRQEAWMDTSVNFAIHIFLALVKLQFFPEWLRPIGQYLVSDLGKIKQDTEKAKKMLVPIIQERLRDMQCPGYEKEDDFIQWLLDALPEEERTDYHTQAELQLLLSAASIHTTNNLLVDCMYDLAANPEDAEELRQEAIAVLEGGDPSSGWARKDSMTKLKKLDSFMKEVQRLSGNVTSFIRKVRQPITLSDGTYLPAGTKLLAPLSGFSHDERYYPEPEKFDPLRFFRMRQRTEDDVNRYQFTSISDNMNFGAGKAACPGRFFAGNEIKMILAYFLINFDVRLKEGQARPKSMVLMMTKSPDPNAELLFRRRTLEK
ncbi:cytochrome P450 [Cryphonectria parasitica EP155]|uniref:Cytochrome P450 n=1 Tax=Cryphonectria parasitica (strain ATCC 38755 / EP155) TaxID=660469 RepID=A0A9P5CUF6_CRYP1|nr:cytochrome P450 [Cryphonectria parasitica EP155]KAF3770642.1 cytochrome P450 [Cryphonectria parasitica EP155]